MSKTIQIVVSDQEKITLDEMAKRHNLSTSKFIKSLISDSLPDDTSTTIASIMPKPAESRNRNIHITVSDSEYEQIKMNAGNKTIARYARQTLLTGTHPIIISVEDEDIRELTDAIRPLYKRIIGIFEAMRMQSKIFPQQVDQLINLQEEIYDIVTTVQKNVYNNRNSIRKSGVRELRRRIKRETEKLNERK